MGIRSLISTNFRIRNSVDTIHHCGASSCKFLSLTLIKPSRLWTVELISQKLIEVGGVGGGSHKKVTPY